MTPRVRPPTLLGTVGTPDLTDGAETPPAGDPVALMVATMVVRRGGGLRHVARLDARDRRRAREHRARILWDRGERERAARAAIGGRWDAARELWEAVLPVVLVGDVRRAFVGP